MSSISKKATFTILSISLLTVMAGAAMAPALDVIRQHFSSAPNLLIQLIVSIPALFIILTNFCFSAICRFARTRTIALLGLSLYVLAGAVAFFVNNIALILVLRSLLGISVGLVMPLSTGLLAYFFPPSEQARLMGLSAAMNQLGGVVATLLAGLLANIDWNYAFLVYLIGLLALILVALYLPNEKLSARGSHLSPRTLLRFHPSVVGMFLLMCIFFIFPTNFAIITGQNLGIPTLYITILMVGLDVVAFFMGLLFGRLMSSFRVAIKYFAPIGFLIGYASYVVCNSLVGAIVGSVFIGLANGVGVPYLNTIASIKGGKESVTTVMPLLSAALYLGQFLSPLIVSPLSHLFFKNDILGPYKVGVLLCGIFLIQVFLTRHFQSLPPKEINGQQ